MKKSVHLLSAAVILVGITSILSARELDFRSAVQLDETFVLRNAMQYTIASRMPLVSTRDPMYRPGPLEMDNTMCYTLLPLIIAEAIKGILESGVTEEKLDHLFVAYDSQFNPDSHQLYYDGEQWMNRNCSEPDTAHNATEGSFVQHHFQRARVVWCRVREQTVITSFDVAELEEIYEEKRLYLESKDQKAEADYNSSKDPPLFGIVTAVDNAIEKLSSDEWFDKMTSFLPPRVREALEQRSSTAGIVFGSYRVLKFILLVSKQPMGYRMRDLTARYCRLIELEARFAGAEDLPGCDLLDDRTSSDNLAGTDDAENDDPQSELIEPDDGAKTKRLLVNGEDEPRLTPFDRIHPNSMPITCGVTKLLYTITACVAEIPLQDMPNTCYEFERRWDSGGMIRWLTNDQGHSTCYADEPEPGSADSEFVFESDSKSNSEPDSELVSELVSGSVSESVSKLDSESDSESDSEKLKLRLEFDDLRPLPNTIPVEYREREVASHYGLLLGLIKLYYMGWNPWFSCPTQLFDKERELVPGWRLFHAVFLRTHDQRPYDFNEVPDPWILPWALLSENDWNHCEILISFKGSSVISDWATDVLTWSTPIAYFDIGAGHAGFLKEILPILPSLEALLEERSEKYNCSCDQLRLIFNGHSMGAGFTALITTILAKKYHQMECNVKIDAILFTPPLTLDDDLTEYYRTHVNGRTYQNPGDPITFLPCNRLTTELGVPTCSVPGLGTPHGIGMNVFANVPGVIQSVVMPSDVTLQKKESALGSAIATNAWSYGQTSLRDVIPQNLFDANKALRLVSNTLMHIVLTAVREFIPALITKTDVLDSHVRVYACSLVRVCAKTKSAPLCDHLTEIAR